jgi:hypothetical protein
VPIPTPYFIVLYNGTQEAPDVSELRLSDAYMDKSLRIDLDLVVRVYNINEGRNPGMLDKSKSLRDYSSFVAEARRLANANSAMGLTDVIKQAVVNCIDNDVMRDFLTKNASEVVNMMLEEFNLEKAKEVWQKESREEARKEEREKSRRKIEQALEGERDKSRRKIEQALEEEREKSQRKIEQVAVIMLGNGMSMQKVSEATGVDVERLRVLVEGLNNN